MRLYQISFEQKILFEPFQMYELALSTKNTTEKLITK